MHTQAESRTMIGAFGSWAATLAGRGPAALSFRNPRFASLSAWRRKARTEVLARIAPPESGRPHRPRVDRQCTYEGLAIEWLSWQLPCGPRTEAIFLKPSGARGRLPAVLALHDHSGNKYWGWRKIVRTPERLHPLLRDHQAHYYSGMAWASELARRGYAVLVPDAFAFGSRRVRYANVDPVLVGDRVDRHPDRTEEIRAYNSWAYGHEHIMAKSLFSAGTTWPGVFWHEDRCALDVLAARSDVDPARLACGGLSGGGLRTVLLAGLDERIRAAFPVGFMSTWRDFLLHKCHTHTWMLYIPLLPRFLDFPEILGLAAPRAAFVLNNTGDSLFTLSEMRRADRMLRDVYRKAGSSASYRCRFYPGGHKFDAAMQTEAFNWLDAILRPAG